MPSEFHTDSIISVWYNHIPKEIQEAIINMLKFLINFVKGIGIGFSIVLPTGYKKDDDKKENE